MKIMFIQCECKNMNYKAALVEEKDGQAILLVCQECGKQELFIHVIPEVKKK